MTQTPNLQLSYILAAQEQKHVTHNEALRALDALVQMAVVGRNLALPPVSPLNGARYIVAASPSGAWSGHTGKIAAWQDGAWQIYTPREGWIAWVEDEGALVAWSGSAWVTAGGGGSTSLNPASGGLVGINTTADVTDRLAVKSPASLFDNDGSGHQQKINKAAVGDTASQLYQTSYSGRAEIGLAGDDDFHFKVSPDGASWKEAMRIDRASGVVSFPFTPLGVRPNLLVNGDFGVNQRAFAFGALADGAYGVDRWKGVGATDIGWDAATQTITLNAGAIRQVVEPLVWGHGNLASQQVTVSVEGLTGGNLTVAVGSASGVITPGSGRRAVMLTLGAGDTGNLAVTLTPASYPTWWKRVKLEVGASATEWQARDGITELGLCMRYFWRIIDGNSLPMAMMQAYTASNLIGLMLLPRRMRVSPSGAISGLAHFGAFSAAGGVVTPSSLLVYGLSPQIVRIDYTGSSAAFVAGNVSFIATLSASARLDLSAEL